MGSDFRGTTGTECLRLTPFRGEEVKAGGETDRGGVADGDGVVAHSDDSGVYAAFPLVLGSQDEILLPAEEGREAKGSCSGVPIKGVVEEEVALDIMDRGARILNI